MMMGESGITILVSVAIEHGGKLEGKVQTCKVPTQIESAGVSQGLSACSVESEIYKI